MMLPLDERPLTQLPQVLDRVRCETCFLAALQRLYRYSHCCDRTHSSRLCFAEGGRLAERLETQGLVFFFHVPAGFLRRKKGGWGHKRGRGMRKGKTC